MHGLGCEAHISSNDVIALLSAKDAQKMRERIERGEPLMSSGLSSRSREEDPRATHGLSSKLPRALNARLREMAPIAYGWLDTRVAHLSARVVRVSREMRDLHDDPPTSVTLSIEEARRLHSFEV